MKNNSHFRNKSKKLTYIGYGFLLLCVFLTSYVPKTWAKDSFMNLQSTYVTLNLIDVSFETLFKTLEKKSDYVFFFKEDVLQKNEKVTVKAQNESVVSILNRVLPPKQLTYTVKGRQVIIVRQPQKEEKKTTTPVAVEKDYDVKGTIVDVNGQPLPGVNITVQGTTTGVTTDLSGSFTLRIRDGKRALLVASYIGFSTKKVWVSAETGSLKIVLEESSASLNEVVVVGYGTQKKLNLTGAVTTASGEILENRPIGNIAQGLQGMVPNLNITFNSGQPNQAANINIRGNTSLNGGNALVLVDGVEISDLSLINPQDVESVSVLKDASAAAVYGARAAFGVMLVTTKKGARNQKTKVSYSNNLSWSSPARLPEMPRSDIWARMWNKAYEYDTPGGYYFNEKFMEKLDAHIADPEHNPAILVDTEGIQNSNYSPSNPGWAYVGNTDWLSEFYQKSAFMQQHNVSLSGGTERNNYYASIGFKDQSGIFRYGNDSYKRFNLAFNFDTKLTSWLDVSFATRMSNIKNDEPYMDNGGSSSQTWYYEVYRMYPTLSIFLPNGDFAGMYLNSGNYNVIGKMALAGRNKKETNGTSGVSIYIH
jgi:TonB-linked SusC/RagA family outer membrane protein